MAALECNKGQIILITVILTIVFFVLILLMLTWQGVNFFIDKIIRKIGNEVEKECMTDELMYRGKVIIPNHISCSLPIKNEFRSFYDKKLATILWDIGGAVSSSNCKDGIPTPLPFTNQYKISSWYNHSKMEKWYTLKNNKEVTHGYLFWNDDTVCMIFSGTYHESQWRNNINLDLKSLKCMKEEIDENIKIHSGFLDVYMSIRETLWSWWNKHGNGIKNIIISGRSLGGAISTICAYDFSELTGNVTILNYTFASPRVGNREFSEDYNKKVPCTVRIYNTEDIIIQLPPAVWRKNLYQHVGTSLNTVAFTKHLGTFYDNHIEAYRILPD